MTENQLTQQFLELVIAIHEAFPDCVSASNLNRVRMIGERRLERVKAIGGLTTFMQKHHHRLLELPVDEHIRITRVYGHHLHEFGVHTPAGYLTYTPNPA